jgi:hypothetical protein
VPQWALLALVVTGVIIATALAVIAVAEVVIASNF